jgi:hypothetical protein
MQHFISRQVRAAWLALLCAWLSGCAMVQTQSRKDPTFQEKLSAIDIRSGLWETQFNAGVFKPSEPFPATLRHSLMAELQKRHVTATMTSQSAPAYAPPFGAFQRPPVATPARLEIFVTGTSTRSTGGFTHTELAVFDLGLYSGVTGQRVWRASITIDASTDLPKWGEGTAARFANEIVLALARDGLL